MSHRRLGKFAADRRFNSICHEMRQAAARERRSTLEGALASALRLCSLRSSTSSSAQPDVHRRLPGP